jgi:hypothetical protein
MINFGSFLSYSQNELKDERHVALPFYKIEQDFRNCRTIAGCYSLFYYSILVPLVDTHSAQLEIPLKI